METYGLGMRGNTQPVLDKTYAIWLGARIYPQGSSRGWPYPATPRLKVVHFKLNLTGDKAQLMSVGYHVVHQVTSIIFFFMTV